MKTVLFHWFAIRVYRRMFMHQSATCAVDFSMNIIFLEKLILTSFAFVVCLHLNTLYGIVLNFYCATKYFIRNFSRQGKEK